MTTQEEVEPLTGIPVAAYAEAAYAVCYHMYGKASYCGDVFDSRVEIRGRYVAIAALRAVWTSARQAEIARNMGVEGTSEAIANRMMHAATAKWWDEKIVKEVETLLRIKFEKQIVKAEKARIDQRTREEIYDTVATEPFVARKVHPVRRIFMTRRQKNVTGALLGDPGHTSYRVMTNQRSAE